MLQISKSAQYLEELTPDEVMHLTSLLRIPSRIPSNLQIDRAWHRSQATTISNLPAALLRPASRLARLATHLSITSPTAILCPTHKHLSGQLIRHLFFQVTAEITSRLHHLAAPDARATLHPNVLGTIRRLEVLNSLWMSGECYRNSFAVMPAEMRYNRVESGCEGCILARIGGDAEVLRDLRAAVLSRRSKRVGRKEPRLLRIVDAWVEWSAAREDILEASDSLARHIRHARKKSLRARKVRKGSHQETKTLVSGGLCEYDDCAPLLKGVGSSDPSSDSDDDGFEIDIIEYYRSRLSAVDPDTYLGLGIKGVSTHDSNRDTRSSMVLYSALCESLYPGLPSTKSKIAPEISTCKESLYSQSSYSVACEASIINTPTAASMPNLKQDAEARALEYAKLLNDRSQTSTPVADRKGKGRAEEVIRSSPLPACSDTWEDYL